MYVYVYSIHVSVIVSISASSSIHTHVHKLISTIRHMIAIVNIRISISGSSSIGRSRR